MAIINAKFVEIEIQEQSISNRQSKTKKFMVQIKYDTNQGNSLEIASILLTDNKPLIISTFDTGSVVIKQKQLSY